MQRPRNTGAFSRNQGSWTAVNQLTIRSHIEMKSISGEAWRQDFVGPKEDQQGKSRMLVIAPR